jgi:1-acyl-sn-glycerol-3-phosphate acyltransferase
MRPGYLRYLHHPLADAAWGLLAEALCRYFRVEVSGLENIPRTGPVIVIANHSGYAGADAIILAHLIHTRLHRKVEILAHPYYFRLSRTIRRLSLGFGLREACYRTARRSLKAGKALIVFPEGEAGNFKSSLKRYHLQPFHTGFARLASSTQATVIRALVIGAEESHLNLGSVGFSPIAPKLRVPLPLNWLPLPARWKIRFFLPETIIAPKTSPTRKQEWARGIASSTQTRMQTDLEQELALRRSIYR